jgi:hypothetical protein
MEHRLRLYIALLLNILMGASVYLFAYTFSVFAIYMGPFFWFCNIAGFVMAYSGFGRILDMVFAALRNDELEIRGLVSGLRFVSDRGRVVAGLDKGMTGYVLWSLLTITLFGFFGTVMYFYTLELGIFQESKNTLEKLFFVFWIVGMICGMRPVRERLKQLALRFATGRSHRIKQRRG